MIFRICLVDMMKNTFKRAVCVLVLVMLFVCVFSACGEKNGGKIPENNARNGMIDESFYSEDTTLIPEMTKGAENTTAPFSEDENINKKDSKVIKGENTGTFSTLTGFEKLAIEHYEVSDPDNKRNLSTEKVCHSHGPASGGEAHFTVKQFQKHFDKYNALTLDTVSKDKRLYLTFDCGYEYNNLTSKILDTLKEKNVPAAFFCTLHHIKTQPELITRIIKEGHIVGNHSDTHPSFAEISRTQMAKEIENCDNFLRENYGYSAKFFRFPAGEYTDSALDQVSSMGFTSVFWSVAYSDWDTNNPHGKEYAVRTVTERLHPGAVILLHSVSQDNADALGEIIDKARNSGYRFCSLEEYGK